MNDRNPEWASAAYRVSHVTISKNPPNKPDWLPDWTDITKYPDPKKATGRVWAWEFLRRNPQYQQRWEEYSASGSGDRLMYIRPRFETEFAVLSPVPPSMPFTHPDFEWRLRFTTQSAMHWILPVGWEDIEGFELPEIDLDHPAEVLVKFDLRVPLNPQLRNARKVLETEAERLTGAGVLSGEPRAWFDKYQKYLRVLDAKLSGVNRKTMAVEILDIKNDDPEYQKGQVDYAFRAAKRLRDKDYRFLAALEGK